MTVEFEAGPDPQRLEAQQAPVDNDGPPIEIRSDFPRSIQQIENCWIPLSDGTRLAATVWLPVDAEQDPVPAILEYIPYRKRDFTAAADALTHPYFAGHGYAAVRVDIRGSGDSDGILDDEYLPLEQADCLEVLRWLAQQSWCSGAVGMMGISWGGFNALQVAALAPPELKAIVTVCSTDDRFRDDVHYMGGCVLNDGISWGSGIFTVIPRPPDPLLVGERWREMWLQRLENTRLALLDWLQHQQRDDYWAQGSVSEDYAAIRCAVLAVGGWVDGYSNAIFRLVENLSSPCAAIIGPWTHVYPHFGSPTPAIGFLQETLRWWDRWLKGTDTGVEQEPRLRVWVASETSPGPGEPTGSGRWEGIESWPPASQRTMRFGLDERGRLLDENEAADGGMAVRIASPQSTGLAGGEWCPRDGGGAGPEFQLDQRQDDAGSLVFDTPILDEDVEICGAASLDLDLSVDRANGLIAVRLCDVNRAGVSTRVSFAVLNLTHRNGHEAPQLMVPGQRTRVHVRLNEAAYRFAAGHRIRLSISTAYWPMVWPSPDAVTLDIHVASSRVHLPLSSGVYSGQAVEFGRPECSPPLATTEVVAANPERRVTKDFVSGTTTLVSDEHRGRYTLNEIGLTIGATALERYRVSDEDPASALTEMQRSASWERGDWRIRIETDLSVAADGKQFRVQASLRAFENDRRMFEKTWDERVPRRWV